MRISDWGSDVCSSDLWSFAAVGPWSSAPSLTIMAGRLLAAMAPSFVFRHVGGRHGGERAQPLFGNAMQILVIEDDDRVAEHIAKGLKTAGHGVALESDGRAGLLRAAADAFDLIVVDRMRSE